MQRGVDIYKISILLAHAHISMSTRYVHHCPESLRDGMNILENLGHDLVTLEGNRICQLPETLDVYGGR